MPKYDNSGILFRNNRRQNDRQPEFNGSITVEGTEYWLSAWVKDGDKGKFFSLSVKPKDEQRGEESQESPDEDIPF